MTRNGRCEIPEHDPPCMGKDWTGGTYQQHIKFFRGLNLKGRLEPEIDSCLVCDLVPQRGSRMTVHLHHDHADDSKDGKAVEDEAAEKEAGCALDRQPWLGKLVEAGYPYKWLADAICQCTTRGKDEQRRCHTEWWSFHWDLRESFPGGKKGMFYSEWLASL